MADKCEMCLLGLIILCSLLTGTSGAEVNIFSSFGYNVRLPCNNAPSDCTSTTWTYSRHSGTIKLFSQGIKKNDIDGHERLSLTSDCSLKINTVRNEDCGFYTCLVNEQQYGTDARVYLHVLHVSSSFSQTEIRPGSSLTLSCQLFHDGVSCESLVRSGIQLMWVNQAGMTLQTDSSYQISFFPTRCISTLTTTLQNEDHNREWRCLVTQTNEPKASATYTVKYSAQGDTTTPVIPAHVTYLPIQNKAPAVSTTLIPVSSSNAEKRSSQTTAAPTKQAPAVSATLIPVRSSNAEKRSSQTTAAPTKQVIVIIVEIAVFAAPTVILLQIICAKRAGRKDSHNSEEIKMSTILE
ncbi:hypothetical protein QQF64_009854 [Cirrhinus molitorella]|uniref:Ig-like domain-containing protein n=1 Tax=Cirrhinus molitorella TaxID=172907 RepID=A0ABR3M2B3_9TELE